ncbi:MAG TPA: hypothetical protein VFU36_08550, partial [Jatrophihabitans sp.]|nr:hypothetical protein [Jatrophihabitans sp.]
MTGISFRRPPGRTPDAHLFRTREYDLVKEFVIALGIVLALSLLLAGIFSSPDRKPITLQAWAQAAPNDVVATATAELAGTSTSATYGPPYNDAGSGQQIGPIKLQKWAGVRIPVDSAQELVLDPLASIGDDSELSGAMDVWHRSGANQQASWAAHYSDALAAAPDGDPSKVQPGQYGPVPLLADRFLQLARGGGLESLLASPNVFYPADQTRALLLLSDGGYLEDQARAEHLGGDQWGMMNESGNYPGQPWMWLYT